MYYTITMISPKVYRHTFEDVLHKFRMAVKYKLCGSVIDWAIISGRCAGASAHYQFYI